MCFIDNHIGGFFCQISFMLFVIPNYLITAVTAEVGAVVLSSQCQFLPKNDKNCIYCCLLYKISCHSVDILTKTIDKSVGTSYNEGTNTGNGGK